MQSLYGLECSASPKSYDWPAARLSFDRRETNIFFPWKDERTATLIVFAHDSVRLLPKEAYSWASDFLKIRCRFAIADNNQPSIEAIACLNSQIDALVPNQRSHHKVKILVILRNREFAQIHGRMD